MKEADEVSLGLLPGYRIWLGRAGDPANTYERALRYVKLYMDDTETVVERVAWSLYQQQKG